MAIFSLCWRFIALIVFDLSCSQTLDKFYFFYVSLDRNLTRWDRSTTTKTYDHYEHNIVIILHFVSDL